MKKLSMVTAGSVFIALGTISSAQGAIITFNDAISGAPSYSFDGDGDGINDVIFTTTDPNGFNTVGPGLNMTYVQQPGLEGTSLLPVDLRVDFLIGAENYLKFGFALNSGTESPQTFTSFQVYDRNNNLLASDLGAIRSVET